MDDRQMIEVVTNEIGRVYGLNSKQIDLLSKNIVNRVKLYHGVRVTENEQSVFVNDVNGLCAFFLDRLVNNIREYEFDTTYNMDSTTKGTYTAKEQKLYLASEKFLQDKTREKLKNRIINPSSEIVDKAVEKVFNHEMGHALQVDFGGNTAYRNDKYREVVHNLKTQYPHVFKGGEVLKDMDIKQHGMVPVKKDDSKQKVRDFYARMALTTYLDEIFNEDEALAVTGIDRAQLVYDMGGGFYKKIYNYESSNYKITSYAQMMKMIMGKQRTFHSMYVDSILTYEFFDQFMDLSNEVFRNSKYAGKAPMLNILHALDAIRNNRNDALMEANNLDLFFTVCFCKKMENELRKDKLEIKRIEKMEREVEAFFQNMIHNRKGKLRQEIYIEELKEKISTRKKIMESIHKREKVNNSEEGFIHPRVEELRFLEEKKRAAREKNDMVSYKRFQEEMKTIVKESRVTVTPEEWDKMHVNQRISFFKVKMNEARVLQDKDEFNYWQANLHMLEEKIQKEKSSMNGAYSPNQGHENSKKSDGFQNADKEYYYYFDEMMKILGQRGQGRFLTSEEKKKVVSELYYYETKMVECLKSEEEIREVMTLVGNQLKNDEFETKLFKVVMSDLELKLASLRKNSSKKSEEGPVKNSLNVRIMIDQLKGKLQKIQNSYHMMMADGVIDDEELEALLNMVNKVLDDGYNLKVIASSTNDKKVIEIILSKLEEEQGKMIKLQSGMKNIAVNFG